MDLRDRSGEHVEQDTGVDERSRRPFSVTRIEDFYQSYSYLKGHGQETFDTYHEILAVG